MLRRGTRKKKVPISGGEVRSDFTNDSIGSQDIHFLQDVKLLILLISSRYGNYESWLLVGLYTLPCKWTMDNLGEKGGSIDNHAPLGLSDCLRKAGLYVP